MTQTATHQPAIAIACGGTGGHLFPGLAVAEQCTARGCAVTLLISPKEVDQHGVRQARGVEVVTLPAVAWQRDCRLAFLRGFLQSWLAARKLFQGRRPDAVLGMGGFTSAPPLLAARRGRTKTFLHESNTIPGRANRWLASHVDHVFVGFSQAGARLGARGVTVTGTPVRSAFRPYEAVACRVALGLEPGRPVVLVVGGSQGATGINELVISSLPQFAQRAPQWQWIHLAGPNDVKKVREAYAAQGLAALVQPFLLEMDQVLSAASVVVSRAGASSLAEFAAMRLPPVLVPFPFAVDDHQLHNARAFADTGAARLLEQKGATPDQLVQLLAELVENPVAAEQARAALAKWHAPDAAGRITDIILSSLGAKASSLALQRDVTPTSKDLKLRAVA